MSKALKISLLGALIFTCSCVPAHLQRYRRSGNISASKSSEKSERQTPVRTKKLEEKIKAFTKITALSSTKFKISVAASSVFDSALNSLIDSYTLSIINKDTGVISTNWDSYYIGQTVYRNRITLRTKYESRSVTEIIIQNSIEKLQDGSVAGTVGAVWLPAHDEGAEVGRVIKNIGLALGITETQMDLEKVASIEGRVKAL